MIKDIKVISRRESFTDEETKERKEYDQFYIVYNGREYPIKAAKRMPSSFLKELLD